MSREYDHEDADFDNLLDPYTPVKRNRVNADNIARGERASAVSYRESTNRLMLATIRKNLADWDGEARGVWRGANLADLIARSEKGEDGDPAARLDVESLRLLQREVRSHVREGKPLHVWLADRRGAVRLMWRKRCCASLFLWARLACRVLSCCVRVSFCRSRRRGLMGGSVWALSCAP